MYSAYVSYLRYSISVRGNGQKAANITRKLVLHICEAERLLWGDPERKPKNSAAHRNLLWILWLSVPWTLSMSTTKRQVHLVVLHYGSVRTTSRQARTVVLGKKMGQDLILTLLWFLCTAHSIQKGCKGRELVIEDYLGYREIPKCSETVQWRALSFLCWIHG